MANFIVITGNWATKQIPANPVKKEEKITSNMKDFLKN